MKLLMDEIKWKEDILKLELLINDLIKRAEADNLTSIKVNLQDMLASLKYIKTMFALDVEEGE